MISKNCKFLIFWSFLLGLTSQAHAAYECYNLIEKFYECSYSSLSKNSNDSSLKETTQNEEFKIQAFDLNVLSPSSSATTTLNDSFYKEFGLLNMSFDESMELFKSIYDELEDCETDLCKCVTSSSSSSYVIGGDVYSVFFRDEALLQQIKGIISAFIEAYKASLRPTNVLVNECIAALDDDTQLVLPTLCEFCVINDYSKDRLKFYNSIDKCFMENRSV